MTATTLFGLESVLAEELKNLGLKMEKHHHEVAPSQHELGLVFDTLLKQGDAIQLYKYGACQLIG